MLDPSHDMHPHSTGQAACDGFAWLDLCGMARWKSGGGLQRGQARAGQNFLAARWNWSRGKVQRWLADREAQNMILREHGVGRRPDIITICNYEIYNDPWSRSDHRADSERINEQYNERYNERITKDLPVPIPVPRTKDLTAADAAREAGRVGTSTEEDSDGDKERVQVADSGQRVDDHRGDDRGAQPDDLRSPDRDPATERQATAWIVARWVDASRDRGVEPSATDRAKQGKAAQRVARTRPFPQIPEAVEGIGKMWQFDPAQNGAAGLWDCFDLERLFPKAVEAGVNPKLGRGAHKLARNLSAIDEAMTMIGDQ